MIQCPEVTAEQTGPVFKASVLLPAPVLLSMPRATSVGILPSSLCEPRLHSGLEQGLC